MKKVKIEGLEIEMTNKSYNEYLKLKKDIGKSDLKVIADKLRNYPQITKQNLIMMELNIRYMISITMKEIKFITKGLDIEFNKMDDFSIKNINILLESQNEIIKASKKLLEAKILYKTAKIIIEKKYGK